MIKQALTEQANRRDSEAVEMAEKTDIDVMEMYAVEGQHEMVQSTVSLVTVLVVRDVLDERLVARHMSKIVMRAVAHLTMINSVANAFLRDDDLMTLIATFVSNYDGKE